MNTRDYSRLQSAFADRTEVAEADWWPERRRAFDTALAKIAAGRSPLVVQGAAGVGKSAFLMRLQEAIEPLRKTSLVSAADALPASATADCAAGPPNSADDSSIHSLDDPGDAPADCARPGVLLVDDLHLAEEWWVRRMVAPCPDCPAPDVSHPRPLLVGTTERRALRSGLPGLGGEEDIGADNCIVLDPMTRTDVEAFVEARLIRAGYDGPPPFTEEAMDRIHFYSRGLPGRVNRLCRAALIVAAERGAWPVGEALMREVAWSLFLPESLKDRLPALGHSRPEAGPDSVGAPEAIGKALAAAGPGGLAALPAAALEQARAAPAGRSRRSSARRLSMAAVACFAAGIGIAVHLASEGAGPHLPEPQLASETVPEMPPAHAADADILDPDPPERAPDLAPTKSPQPQPAFAVAADPEAAPEPMPELASPPAPEPVAAADSGGVPDTAASDVPELEAMATATPAAAAALDVDCASGATELESAPGAVEAPPECGRVSPEDRAQGPSHPLPQEARQEVRQQVPEVPQQVSEVPERPQAVPVGETSSSPMLVPEIPERPQAASAVADPSGPSDVDLAPERKRRPPARARTLNRAPSERVATAQGLLAQLGYSPGPVDGAEGPRTRRAIRAYQTRHGLPATGVVDDRVLALLRRDTATQQTRAGAPSLLTSVIRTISATVGPRVDSVEDPGSVVRYCRNNRDTWVYDFGKDRPVFCKHVDLPDG